NAYECTPGSAQPAQGQVSCQSCAPGTYSNISGSTTCTDCPSGTFQGNSGSTDCDDCPAGTTSDPGSVICDGCETTFSTLTDTVCTEYEAPDGQIYSTSGEYVATIQNAEGCDSVITIHLTVNGITATGNSVEATPGFADGYASVVVTGGTPPFTYLWDDPFFQTSSIAIGLFPGSYTCLISDAVGCTATVEVEVELFTGIPSIHLNDTYCNASGFVLSDFIACIGVENAEAYRWELTEAGENSLPEYTRIGNKYLRLLWVSGIELGTTYEVRVKARVGGIWGEYGDVCTITTIADIPLTEVRPQYHPTNAAGNEYALCDMISAYNVANSTNFRWRFDPDTDLNNGNEL